LILFSALLLLGGDAGEKRAMPHGRTSVGAAMAALSKMDLQRAAP
jgi:hypothetical protein